MLTVAPLVLGACFGSTASVRPDAPPPSLMQTCATPGQLPERDLTQREVEVFWIRDRAGLVSCGGQVQALQEWARGVSR
jgi:hypothetical protein